MNIGERIRKYRLEKDKKQQEIYETIGINHTNNDNSPAGPSIIVNNNHSLDLIVSLKEQIDLLKEQNQINKEIISNLKEENILLKVQQKK